MRVLIEHPIINALLGYNNILIGKGFKVGNLSLIFRKLLNKERPGSNTLSRVIIIKL